MAKKGKMHRAARALGRAKAVLPVAESGAGKRHGDECLRDPRASLLSGGGYRGGERDLKFQMFYFDFQKAKKE